MSVLIDVADNNEFWSQTNFTQNPDFPLDTEYIGPQFIEPHIDDFVEIAEWDVEDTAASEDSPGTSPIYNGRRLLPKIREQDRFLAPMPSSKHEANGGHQSSNPPLARFTDPSKTIASLCSTTDGLYDSFTQQVFTQEQFQDVTLPPTSFELVPSNLLPHTPEDHSNYVPLIYESSVGLLHDQLDNSYLSYDGQNLACFASYKDLRDSPLANKSRTTMPLVETGCSSMYPSARPRAMHALAQNPLPSLSQITTQTSTGQSHYPYTISTKQTTLLRYLGLLNPAPHKIKRIGDGDLPGNKIWFFDVRNVRCWSDFKLETMLGVPELRSLLLREVLCDDLPTPLPVTKKPATEQHLRLAYRDYYGVMLNAALKSSMAQPTLQMYSRHGGPSLTTPDFTSSTSHELSPAGNNRVVGLILPHLQWKTEMRVGDANERIQYLHGLARLQHLLRENNCRYGFIITEIELVCARYGGNDTIYDAEREQTQTKFSSSHITSSHHIPIFGFFEVTDSIPLRYNNTNPYGRLTMTAGLALWYLHMQAQDQALPGHEHWKIQVGAPAALTRQKHLPRDPWTPKINEREKRWARLYRGFGLPDEDLDHKREVKKNRRTVKGQLRS